MTADAYHTLAAFVASAFGQDEATVRARWVEGLFVTPGDQVLDVGAGPGSTSAALREAGARVICLDVDHALLAATTGPRVVGDACELPFADGAVDAVFAQGLLHVVMDPAAFLAECGRVVKPGGVVLIVNKGLAPWLAGTADYRAALELLGLDAVAWPPLGQLPPTATDVSVRWTVRNTFFALRWWRAGYDD